MKAAAKVIFFFVCATSLIAVLFATSLSFIELIFAIVDSVTQGYRTSVGALIKALILLAFIFLFVKGLALFGIASGKGALGFLRGSFAASKSLVSKSGLSSMTSNIKGIPSGLLQNIDGKKLNALGKGLNRAGFKGLGKTAKRAGAVMTGVEELSKIAAKGADGKAVPEVEKEAGKALVDSAGNTLSKTSAAVGDDIRNSSETNQVVNILSNKDGAIDTGGLVDGKGFSEVSEGISENKVATDVDELPNGLSTKDVIDSAEAFNGEVSTHLTNAGGELGALDKLASDTATAFNDTHEEIQGAKLSEPVAGADLLDRQQGLARTGGESLAANLFSSSNALEPVANIEEDKIPFFASDSNGLDIDEQVAGAHAEQLSEHQDAVISGYPGFESGSTSPEAIAVSSEIEPFSELESMGDTLHGSPMYGLVATDDVLSEQSPTVEFIQDTAQGEFEQYVDGMSPVTAEVIEASINGVDSVDATLDDSHLESILGSDTVPSAELSTDSISVENISHISSDEISEAISSNMIPVNMDNLGNMSENELTADMSYLEESGSTSQEGMSHLGEYTSGDNIVEREIITNNERETYIPVELGEQPEQTLTQNGGSNDFNSFFTNGFQDQSSQVSESAPTPNIVNNENFSTHNSVVNNESFTTNNISNSVNNVVQGGSSLGDVTYPLGEDQFAIKDKYQSQIEDAIRSASERSIEEAEELEKKINLERLWEEGSDGKII